MKLAKEIKISLSYDDVLIKPGHSLILPNQANLESKFSKNIILKSPLVTAAMDTVTEAQTAIAIARNGGIGVIHKNMSVAEQALEVFNVKKSEAGMITKPTVAKPDFSVGEVISIMKEQNISGLPVVEGEKLVGIVTGRDIRFEVNTTRAVHEIMTVKVVTVREGASPKEALALMHEQRIEKLPVVTPSGKLVGLFTIKDIEKTRKYPHASKDANGRLLAAASIGASGDYLVRLEALLEAGVDAIIIDTSHGHSQGVLDSVAQVKDVIGAKNVDVIAGNVATAQGALALVEMGVDAVKVGVGPGSICTTRIVTGVGVPQFSAVLNCCAALKGTGVPVIADGGIKYSGDVVKALAAGAASVMVGSLFAGTDEAPGELIFYQGKSYKSYRGMGSLGAMVKGSKDRYFQGAIEDNDKLVPEGIEGRVSYKGSLEDNIFQVLGGVRSAMGLIGAASIAELYEKSEFVQITGAGLKESHVHDVFITRESPNYKL